MRKFFRHLPLLAAVTAALPAIGGEIPGQLLVSVTVVASCRLSVDTALLSFGSVVRDAGSADAGADVAIRCSDRQPYAITFDGGRHAQGAQRYLGNGDAVVAYQLYSDAARVHPLEASGDGLHGVGNGDEQQVPVYARLRLAHDTPAGEYTDVVRMTVTW